MDTEDPTYAYLIILPSPILGNSIKATGGVEYADPENLSQDEPSKTEKNKLVHYIKLGLQKEPGERVKSYNTDTPSMWFRHLKFKEPESPHDPSSALYLQQRLLQSHKRDFHAQEWFILEDCTDDLEKLCRGLDKAKAEITVKKTDTEDVKVDENVFKDEIACMKKLFGLGGKKVFPVNEATMALLKEEDDKSGSK